MQAEIIALRHQLTVLKRKQPKRLVLNRADRCLWVWLSRLWSGWRHSLIIVKPETVIGWHRQGFRWYWTWKIRHRRSGRPRVPKETRDLIRTMSRENPTWGAPRIHGELMKLDIKVSESSVAKYMVRSPKPPAQTWRTFLDNHVSQLASVDFFTVHTVWFEILFVFTVLAHDRRRIVHFNVTAHPTAEWTAQQMLEAFPFDTAPRYLLRDRDRISGQEFRDQVAAINITEVLSGPGSPWQRAYVERVIGSIRRECLDHVIVFNEESLRRTLRSYFLLLSSIPSSSLFGQRFTGFAFHAIGRQSHLFSRSWWAASSLRTHRVKLVSRKFSERGGETHEYFPPRDQISQQPLP
jgi:putative transposase